MIAFMFKLTLASAIVLTSLAGCAGESANSSPAAAAPGVDFEYNAPEEGTAKDTKSEPAEPETKKSETTKPEAKKAEPAQDSAPKGKHCKGLTKKLCEISEGCAWSTDKVCVDQ
jgi:hypothetical protein